MFIPMDPECERVTSASGTFFLPQLGGAFICQQGCVSQWGMWKMARISHGTFSLAGNNPEITCRDDALMILLMKKPGLSSAETDWKEPTCVRCNGPRLDNPSKSMQPMRPPIWSWNVRGCRVWHLLEPWLCSNTAQCSLTCSVFFNQTEAFRVFESSLGTLAYPVCHESQSGCLVCRH